MGVNVRIRNGLEPNAGNGGATEGDIRGNHTDIIENLSGVVDLAGGHLLVHEATVPAMTVVVDAGVGYIPNTSFDELDSDSIKFWEAVVAGTTGSRTLAISPNSSGSTRIDIVCLTLDPGEVPDEFASDVAELVVTAGTPGAGVPATPSYSLKIAEVTVINGATEIENSDITDSRTQLKFKDEFLSVSETSTNTLQNKRITKRRGSTASSATPTINTDLYDRFDITALATAITSMTTNLSGTPVAGDSLLMRLKDNGTARAITWGASFASRGATLPTTTVLGKYMYVGFLWNDVENTWDCVAVVTEI